MTNKNKSQTILRGWNPTLRRAVLHYGPHCVCIIVELMFGIQVSMFMT